MARKLEHLQDIAVQGIYATGSFGTAGQVLKSDGDNVYWANETIGDATTLDGYDSTAFAILASANKFTQPITVNVNPLTTGPALPTGTLLHLIGTNATQSRMYLDTFGANAAFLGRRANGTNAAPSAILSGDFIFTFGGFGYGTTGYIASASALGVVTATENFTDTAAGAKFSFRTITNGTITPVVRWHIENDGSFIAEGLTVTGNGTVNAVDYFDNGVNINTIYAGLAATNIFTQLQTINRNSAAVPTAITDTIFHLTQADGLASRVTVDSFAGAGVVSFRRANNTNTSKTALANTDFIGAVAGLGYGATGYSAGARAQISFRAAEAWTDAAQGTRIQFLTTPNLSIVGTNRWAIENDGSFVYEGGSLTGVNTINAVDYFDNGVNINTIYASLAATNTFTGNVIVNKSGVAVPTAFGSDEIRIVGATGNDALFWADSFGGPPVFGGRRAEGVPGTPTAVQSGNTLVALRGYGYGTSAYSASHRGSVSVIASENWTNTAHGTRITLATTPNLGASQSARWLVENDGSFIYSGGALTGVSTINAVDYFDNGVNINTIYADATNTLTMANKTLTSPTINGAALSGTFSGTPTFSGVVTFTAAPVFTLSATASGQNSATVQSTDAGAVGATLKLYHDSASPLAGDLAARITFHGKDSGGTDTQYGYLGMTILDPTDTSEDGAFFFRTTVAGAQANRLFIGAGVYHDSATGGDKGNNTLNIGTLYQNNVQVATLTGTEILTNKTLTTPVLGVATATSINGLTITSSTGVLTITNLKTLSVYNTLTLTATDGSTLAIGAGGTLASAAYVATGTSGATIPLLNGTNVWNGVSSTFNYGASGASQVFVGASNAQDAYLYLRANAAQTRSLVYQTGTTNRWQLYADTVAESGSSAGSNFHLRAYDDAGASLGDALSIVRATRVVTFPVAPTFTDAATTRTNLGLGIGVGVQAWDADLDSWALITRAAGFDTFVATPSGANLATLLTTALPVSKGGTNATAAGIAAFNNITGYTAAGATGTTSTNLVFSTSPTLVTPVLGAATATSINGLTLTSSTGVLTITNLKTLSVSNTLTLTATDGSTLAIGAGGTLASAAYVATGTSGATIPLLNGTNTWSATQTISVAGDVPAVNIRSGSATVMTGISFGRTGHEYFVGTVGVANQFFTGSVAGDNVIALGTKLWIGTGDYDTAGSAVATVTVSTFDFKVAPTLNSVAIPTISSTDTLTNKTLTSPSIGGTVVGSPLWTNMTFLNSPRIRNALQSGIVFERADTIQSYIMGRSIGTDNAHNFFLYDNIAPGTVFSVNSSRVMDFALNPTAAGIAIPTISSTDTLTNKTLTSPTLTTPVLGVATATSINGLTITSSTGTLTITNLKTLSVSNTLTLTATDGSTLAIGAGGTLASAAYVATGTSGATIPLLNGTNTWASGQTFSSTVVFSNVPTINAANPIFQFYESDQALDTKLWEHNVNGGVFTFRLVNDAYAAASTIFSVTRSTHLSSVFNFGSTVTLQLNGVAIPTISSTDTFTNKTLTSPTFGGTIAGSPTLSGSWTYISATSFSPQLVIRNTNTDQYGGYLILDKAPSDNLLSVSDALGVLMFRGVDTAGGIRNSAYIQATVQSQTATYVGSSLSFFTSVAGVVDRIEGGFNGGLTLGAPTGSNKGVGTLNATNIYVNDVLVPTISSTSTFTNKTLTTPTINGAALSGTFSGTPTFSGAVAFTEQVTITRGAVPLQITTTVDNGNVEGFIIEGDRATPTANDIVYTAWRLSNSAGTQTEFGRQDIVASTVTAASEASYWRWSVRVAGALTTVARLSGTAFTPHTNDALALGNASLMWSDLFLASGGVINFNNGDVTITHSADTLAFAGAATGYTFDAPLTLSSTAANAPLVITSTEAGATAFTVDLFRNSASPAASDGLAALRFLGRNSTPATITYSSIQSNISDPTAASEDAALYMQTMMAGVLTNALTLGISTLEHRFTTPTDSIVSSQGGNGYGSFLARGSGTNSAYMFFSNVTTGERGRIWATDAGVLSMSTNGGVTGHLAISAAGALTASGVAIPTISSTDTLTNKTLTSPTINGAAVSGTFTGTPTWTGLKTINLNSATAASPGTTGVVLHLSGADAVSTRLWLDGYGVGTNYTARRANGTNAAKTALLANDLIMNNSAFGHDGTAYSTGSQGAMQIAASQNWAVGAHGTRIIFATVADGSITQVARWIVENDGSLIYSGGSATGVSTVNAVDYFDNGVNINTIYADSTNTLTMSNKTLTAPTINGGTIQSRVQTSSETTGTLTVASANKTLAMTGGVTMPNAVFTAGDMITMDPGTAARTITRGASVTMYVNGVDSATATLAANQMGGAYWRSSSVCILTGAVT